jgi:chromatin segregation and condensation protein Rec8/ScpA/Scc1 (kleisin family)
MFFSDISVLACFTEEVVTKECREQWTRRYEEYRRESSALYDAKYSKEERNARFPEIYQKYRRVRMLRISPIFRALDTRCFVRSSNPVSLTDAIPRRGV